MQKLQMLLARPVPLTLLSCSPPPHLSKPPRPLLWRDALNVCLQVTSATSEGTLTVQVGSMSVQTSTADVVPAAGSKASRAAAATSGKATLKRSNGPQSRQGIGHLGSSCCSTSADFTTFNVATSGSFCSVLFSRSS